MNTRHRSWWRWVALCGAAIALLLTGIAVCAWRSPPYVSEVPRATLPTPVMTMEKYGEVVGTHRRPYVVEVASSRGAVLLYGSSHTKNPHDPQIRDIAQRFDAFAPTVVLMEGRLGFLLPGFMNPVQHYGEMGMAYALARQHGIPTYTWEPPRAVEVARMLEVFPADRVALFYVLRPYFSNLRFGRPEDPEAFVDGYRRKRTAYPGLEGTLDDIAAIDSIWQVDFVGHPDWRGTSDEYGLPGYLADLSARSNQIRDEHLASSIIHFVRSGERVFAIAGSSHAVKLDQALRDALTAPFSTDIEE